jgi:S1-C subfamily serine protease
MGSFMRFRIYFASLVAVIGLTGPSAFSQTPPASYLGIGVMEVNPDRAKALNLQEVRGAEVVRVDPNGPAAKAIKEGDVVLEYNGTPVQGVNQFIRKRRFLVPHM